MTEIGGTHTHCDACFKQWCSAEAEPGMSCLNISCPQECGARLHACKLSDHVTRCSNTRILCLNSVSGCPATMVRKRIAQHLVHCPANVIVCGLDYRKDGFIQHFDCGVEHTQHCLPIIGERIARKVAAEKLAEEAECNPNLPDSNYTVPTPEERAQTSASKQRRREEAMRARGSLLVEPRPGRSGDDLRKLPWQDTMNRLLSEDVEQPEVPTSPLEEMEVPPMSPTSPLPDSAAPPSLEALPFQVLKHIGRFCDPSGLTALSRTSRFLRRVCSSLLQECGMVTFGWDKQVDDTWVVTQKVWRFAVDPSATE